MSKTINLEWKVHTENLLKEILENPDCSILSVPINIFGKLLSLVSVRCSEINDPQLNHLMCRLTMYACANPESEYYNEKILEDVEKLAKESIKNGH